MRISWSSLSWHGSVATVLVMTLTATYIKPVSRNPARRSFSTKQHAVRTLSLLVVVVTSHPVHPGEVIITVRGDAGFYSLKDMVILSSGKTVGTKAARPPFARQTTVICFTLTPEKKRPCI